MDSRLLGKYLPLAHGARGGSVHMARTIQWQIPVMLICLAFLAANTDAGKGAPYLAGKWGPADPNYISAATVLTNRSGDQTQPALSYDSASGTYLTAWQDISGIDLTHGIFVRRVSSAGAPLGSENSISSQDALLRRAPELDYNPNTGHYLVVWELEYSGSDRDIYSCLVTASGSIVYGEAGVVTSGTDEANPSVAFNQTQGEFLVVWEQYNGSDFDIYAQRMSGEGALIGGAFSVATGTDNQRSPDVACSLESAECLVVYQGRAYATEDTQIYARRVLPTGGATGSQINISTWEYDQILPRIAHNTNSDEFLVVWDDHHWSWGAERDITASA